MKPSLWLPRIDFRPSIALRLVCFAHAGGGAAPFMRWERALPDRVAVCPVRRPGRETARAEPLLRDVPSIADGAFAALSTLPPKPTILLGHSLGAAVAYEVARRMEAAGRAPELLIVSAKNPPHLPKTDTPLAGLPDSAFVDAVDTRYGGIPQVLRDEPELLAMMLPALRADLEASETFRAVVEPRLSCPIRVCYGQDDRAVVASEMARWGEVTTGEATIDVYPGGHFYLFDDGVFLRRLGDALRRRLDTR